MLASILISINLHKSNAYICEDGCQISDGYLDDNYCDCFDCGDEPSWTCSTCDCPDDCGEFNACDDTSTGSDTAGDDFNGTWATTVSPSPYPTYEGQTPNPTISPTPYPTNQIGNASITLKIESSYYGYSEPYELILIDEGGTVSEAAEYELYQQFGCSYFWGYYDSDSSQIKLIFEGCGYTLDGDSCNTDDGGDIDYNSTWTLKFGTIGGMESAFVDIAIYPTPCQSWQFDLDDFSTTELASVRRTTSSIIFSILFLNVLEHGMQSCICINFLLLALPRQIKK